MRNTVIILGYKNLFLVQISLYLNTIPLLAAGLFSGIILPADILAYSVLQKCRDYSEIFVLRSFKTVLVFKVGSPPQERSWTISEGSLVDIWCTQLYFSCFIGVLSGGCWVIVGCYNGSRYKKVENHLSKSSTVRELSFSTKGFCSKQHPNVSMQLHSAELL